MEHALLVSVCDRVADLEIALEASGTRAGLAGGILAPVVCDDRIERASLHELHRVADRSVSTELERIDRNHVRMIELCRDLDLGDEPRGEVPAPRHLRQHSLVGDLAQ